MASSTFLGDDEEIDLNELTDADHDRRLEASLARFWEQQNQEMAQLEIGTEQDFKNHNDLPLARIKRIMKSDEDVRMISAEGTLQKHAVTRSGHPNGRFGPLPFSLCQHRCCLPKRAKSSSWNFRSARGVRPKSPSGGRCKRRTSRLPFATQKFSTFWWACEGSLCASVPFPLPPRPPLFLSFLSCVKSHPNARMVSSLLMFFVCVFFRN